MKELCAVTQDLNNYLSQQEKQEMNAPTQEEILDKAKDMADICISDINDDYTIDALLYCHREWVHLIDCYNSCKGIEQFSDLSKLSAKISAIDNLIQKMHERITEGYSDELEARGYAGTV